MRLLMKLVVMIVILGIGDVSCENDRDLDDDLNSVIDIVYNPSAGPFQDTSEAFYGPTLIGPKLPNKVATKASISNYIFPQRLKIRNKLSNYGEIESKLSFAPKKAKLLRNGKKIEVQGGLDFGKAVFDESMGKRCILKKEEIETVKKEPILVCTHRPSSQCHYTYITKFKPSQEEICEESFQKQCMITFDKQAYNETVSACYTPVEKVCQGEGPEECRTVYESSCTTKQEEKQPGKFIGDTSCEKIPRQICGAGCTFEEGVEECHDKLVTSVVDIPKEVCDLNPQKICKFVTKLVPKLEPVQECTSAPRETCQLKYSKPSVAKTPLITKWCLDESDLELDETERSNPDPILDTRRALPRNEIKRAENAALTRVRQEETKRKPRVGKLLGASTDLYKQTEIYFNQDRFQTNF